MGRRVTVDANGVVVLVESVTVREPGAKASTRTRVSRKKKKDQESPAPRNWTVQITFSQGRPAQEARSRCPECSATVRTARLAEHRRKVHGHGLASSQRGSTRKGGQQRSPAGRNMVRCSMCTSMVRRDRLEKHEKKVHGAAGKRAPTAPVSSKTVRRAAPSPSRLGGDIGRSGGSAKSEVAGETLREMMEETRFGDKGLGQTVRDNGRFGSIPLYDDYSEEACLD